LRGKRSAAEKKLEENGEYFSPKKRSTADYFLNAVGVTVGIKSRSVRILLTELATQTTDERIWPNGFKYDPLGDGTGILSG
jgi:hypothetical protein